MEASGHAYVAAFGSKLTDAVLSQAWRSLNLSELGSSLPALRRGRGRRTLKVRYGSLGISGQHWFASTADERLYECVKALLTPLYSFLAQECAASGPEAVARYC